MRDTFARTLYAIAQQNRKAFIVVADISPAGSMEAFRQEFPDRFIDVGVAEQSMIGLCAGLALRGCTPFAYTIAPFAIYRPFEQIRVDLCCQNLPVTIVGIGGGVSYSPLGATHHAQEDIAVMCSLPNMAVIAPCDPLETEAATWACSRRSGPTYLRLGKAGEPMLSQQATEPFEFGKVRFLKEGSDICVLSYGPIMKMAIEAASRVERVHRLSVAVASVHTLKPLDTERIGAILERFETVVVVEEHSERGGLGSMVKQMAWERQAKCHLHVCGLKDEFCHVYGSQNDLWQSQGLSAESVFNCIIER